MSDVDPRLVTSLKQLLTELDMLKASGWDVKHQRSLKASETRLKQLEKEVCTHVQLALGLY
jgi:hypothetical protein